MEDFEDTPLNGASLFWTSPSDPRIQIMFVMDGIYSLVFAGIPVMPPNTFDRITYYLENEFNED